MCIRLTAPRRPGGPVLADADTKFDASFARPELLECGCSMHGRRYFVNLTTGELIGCNPEAYLADVLPRLARGISLAEDLPALVPAAWLQAHPDAAVPALNVQQVSRFND